jgi:NTP pyrophosphatase (non-canonical NTP hydrolase)
MVQTRGWEQFHTPRNLAIAISLEAAELLAIFAWKCDYEAPIVTDKTQCGAAFEDKVADLMINILSLCEVLKIDLNTATTRKCRDIVQRFEEAGVPPGSSGGDLKCSECRQHVVPQWHYCPGCGRQLVELSTGRRS